METVSVVTGSRLHFGLIDLNGERGRCDGGTGVYLESPGFELSACKSEKTRVDFEPGAERLPLQAPLAQPSDQGAGKGLAKRENPPSLEPARKNEIEKIAGRFGSFSISIKRAIPPHSGLGSTTQLFLAVAKACSLLKGLDLSLVELASLVGRGGTSGVGSWAFEKGGFIFDAGHSFGKGLEKESFLPSSASRAPLPPILARIEVPSPWLFVCSIPDGKQVFGKKEVSAFKRACPLSRKEVQCIEQAIQAKLIPGLSACDISSFGQGLNELQEHGFKKIEWKLQGAKVKNAFSLLKKNCAGAGLSSFGPLVFGVTDSSKAAERLLSELPNAFISKARNTGAEVRL